MCRRWISTLYCGLYHNTMLFFPSLWLFLCGPLVLFQGRPCVLSLPPFIFWALPHFWKQDVPGLACVTSCFSPRTRYLSNKLWVLYWRMLLKPGRALGVHIAMSKLCPCSWIFSTGKARETCVTSLCAYARTLNVRIHMSSKSPVHTNPSYGSSSTQSILVSTSSASLSSLLHLAPGWLS